MLHCCRTDLLVGFRYYNLSDSRARFTRPRRFPTTNRVAMYDIHDNFSASNDFYGSELGLRTKIYRGRWSLEILTKLAMGNTHRTVNINGQTIKTTADGTTAYDAGVFALNTNSGTYQQRRLYGDSAVGTGTGLPVELPLAGVPGLQPSLLGIRVAVGRSDRLADRPAQHSLESCLPAQQRLAIPAVRRAGYVLLAQGINVGLERRF